MSIRPGTASTRTAAPIITRKAPSWRASARSICSGRTGGRETSLTRHGRARPAHPSIKQAPALRSRVSTPSPNLSPALQGRGTLLAQRRFDIAAVDGDDGGGRLLGVGEIDEGFGDLVGIDLAAQQVARHVTRLAHAARLGAGGNHLVGEKSAAHPVRIHRIGANAVLAVIERVLADEKKRRRLE